MQYFYHNMVRKYVVAFAHLFSDIKVQRNANNVLLEEVKVPIVYATKGKMYYELKQHPMDKELAIVNNYLPRMGFYISGMQYDNTRKLNNMIDIKLDNGERLSYLGVPYNFTFELSILTKNQDDLYQIIEQICVQFTPDKTVTIKELNGLERDVSVNLDSVNLSSIYEYGEEEQRTVSVDMTFTVKGHFYPRLQSEPETLIHKVITQYRLQSNENLISPTVTIQQETPESEIMRSFLYYPYDGMNFIPPEPELPPEPPPIIPTPIGQAEIGYNLVIS